MLRRWIAILDRARSRLFKVAFSRLPRRYKTTHPGKTSSDWRSVIFRRSHMLWFCLLVAFVATLAVSCSGDRIVPTVTPNHSRNLRVAMVLPGPKDDGAWSQSGYEGLRFIEKELGVFVAYTDNTAKLPETSVKTTLRNYAKNGYKFVIGHGGEYLAALEEIAPEFPRTKFSVSTNCPGNNVNLGCLSFRGEELGYLTGAIAALKTKTGKIGFVGGVDYPHMKARAILFERGAKSLNPNLEISIDWVGSWTEPQKAISTVEKQVKSGVDVISISAEPAEEAVYPLAKAWGLYLIGWQFDRYKLAPDRVITSALQDVSQLILKGTILVQKGRWEGKQYKLGMLEGVQELAPFRGALTPAEESLINTISENILVGKIDTRL